MVIYEVVEMSKNGFGKGRTEYGLELFWVICGNYWEMGDGWYGGERKKCNVMCEWNRYAFLKS